MNFYKMAERVDSKESFLCFVQALAEDAEAAHAEPEHMAAGKLNLSPRGWEDSSVAAFLGAISAWASSNSGITGKPMVSEQASWRAFADILLSGNSYEQIMAWDFSTLLFIFGNEPCPYKSLKLNL